MDTSLSELRKQELAHRGMADVIRSQRVTTIRWRIDDGTYDEQAAIPTVVQKLADILDDGEPESVTEWAST